MDDSALAARAAAGDHGAFEELLDRHGGRVLAVATRIAGNRSLAEDFCQEVFLHLLRVLPRYDPARPFVPWLMRVAANLCRNRLRGLRRRPAVSLDGLRESRGEFLEAPYQDPAAEAEQRDLLERVRAARDGLPEASRTVLALRYEAGLSLQQIAEALGGLPMGTVKNRLFRARAALVRELERGEEDDR